MTPRVRSVVKAMVRIIKYFLWVGVGTLIFVLLLLASAYSELRQAAQSALAGKDALGGSIYAIQNQDWLTAQKLASDGQSSFSSSLDSIHKTRSNIAISFISPIGRQIDDIEYLLQTGEIMGRSIQKIIPLAQGLDQVRSGAINGNFYDLSLENKRQFIKYIFESSPELVGLQANLELALMNLDKIHKIGVLWPIYGQISDIKEELGQVAKMLDVTNPLIKLLPALSGYPQVSRFLIIMQNNDELRPAGGFIGVYGKLDVKDGEIQHLETDDSYHLDMPASISDKWQLLPPPVLAKYLEVEKWYLRDANWSPDWPQSARQIEKIYDGVSGVSGQAAHPFTAIIGITPDLVANLISLVGPISVRGETYTPDNFQSLLQYNVEIAYREQDISQWDRKDIIDELLVELKSRLFSLPADKWSNLLEVVSGAISKKDFQIYFSNKSWQAIASELGASGTVANTDSDFLMIVDANLAAFKSDAVVQKDVSYQVKETVRGLEAELHLRYKHEGGFDWRTTRYRSYTRILAPQGSRLISLDGVEEKTANPSIEEEEELGKTSFGFFFTVEPGAEREIILSYTLPDRIAEQWHRGDYTLIVQKQAGRRTRELNVRFIPLAGSARNWTSDLNTDKYFWFAENKK